MVLTFTRNPPETAVKALLHAADLPDADLTPAHLAHFVGAWDDTTLIGIAGIEAFGPVALLHSVAVAAPNRCCGVATALLAHIERHALECGVHSLYLLTTSAQNYFEKRGFSVIARETTPAAVCATPQFTLLCPSSATLMVKRLV